MNFKIGMRIPPLMGAEGIEKLAAWSAQAGLDVLDVPALTAEVRQACDRAGLGIGTVDLKNVGQLFSRDEQRRAIAVDSVLNQMSEVARHGGSMLFICLVPEDVGLTRTEGFEIWKETFPVIVSHAEDLGVFLAIEGWPGRAPNYPALGCTPEMLRAMFEAIPSKNLALNYDPSHLVRLGIDYVRFLGEFGEKVVHCHGKDTIILSEELYEYGNLPATFGSKYRFSDGSWRYTIPGHGLVDWGKIAFQLDAMGYQGAISIELEDHRYWGTKELEEQGIVKSIENLSAYFK